MSHLLGEAVLAEVRPADRVLDMGTGSGVNAVLAAGISSTVLAVTTVADRALVTDDLRVECFTHRVSD